MQWTSTGNHSVRCLSFSIAHPKHPVLWAGTTESHNTPLMACGRKAVVGHVLVPSCLLGNMLQVTAPAVPHLSAPTICGIKTVIWSQCISSTVWKQTPQKQETEINCLFMPRNRELSALGKRGCWEPVHLIGSLDIKQQSTVKFRLLSDPTSFEKTCGSQVLFWDTDVPLYEPIWCIQLL